MFERLVDELGEGFHGDELDRQVVIVDKTESGLVQRVPFVLWYVDYVEGL